LPMDSEIFRKGNCNARAAHERLICFAAAQFGGGLGLMSLQACATRRRRKRRGGAGVFGLARFPTIIFEKNAACPRVATAKIPAARLKSS
jgi:hypothetical protein